MKGKDLYILPSARKEEDWLWVPVEPVRKVDFSLGDEELGKLILEVLEDSFLDLKTPAPDPLPNAVENFSWKSFGEKSNHVAVLTTSNGIKFYPSKWVYSHDGYDLIPGTEFVEEKTATVNLGMALRKAFELSA